MRRLGVLPSALLILAALGADDRSPPPRALKGTMFTQATIIILAALYHESGRQSVATGATLAHTVGQARPFTEFGDLRHDARRGRELTAERMLERLEFSRLPGGEGSEPTTPAIDTLARAIHECERDAVDRGWVVVLLDPPRPWITFDDLPPAAQEGRRNQARYFLARFNVTPRT